MNYPGRLIKKGETDKAIIRAVQKQLNDKGYGPLDISVGVFGPKTVSAVKLFQAQNTDQNGDLLKPDGVVGAITWAVLFGQTSVPQVTTIPKKLPEKAIDVANSQKGVREVGRNSGPEVDAYLKSVGLGKGYAWCMAFVYWCFDKAAKDLGQANPLVKTGGVLRAWNEATCTKILAKDSRNNPALVKPGQIFIMDYGGGYGHTGIVKQVSGGFITTIEGNTNNNKSREGIGVFEHIRKIKDVNKGFLQY